MQQKSGMELIFGPILQIRFGCEYEYTEKH